MLTIGKSTVAGSGTTGMAAHELGREFILVDNNPEALEVMVKRFSGVPGVRWEGCDRQLSDLETPPWPDRVQTRDRD
jgi:hypothetical protein